jgi:hypothetical protein
MSTFNPNASAIEIADFVRTVHDKATHEAQRVAEESLKKMGGDWGTCGFAWVKVFDVRSNSKLGKALCSVGFSKAYGGGLEIWNPSKANTQSIQVKEDGARAYAKILKEELGLEKCWMGSRVD